MSYKYEHDTLSYEEPILIGKKVIGKDEKGKDIIDAFYSEFKTRTRKAPAKLTDEELSNLVNELIDKLDYVSIHEHGLYKALIELMVRRKMNDPSVHITEAVLDVMIDSYVYNYIDKLKSFGKTQVQRLSALLELKERRILASIQ